MKTRVILAVTLVTAVFLFVTLFYGTAQSGSGHRIIGREAEPTKPVKRTKPPAPRGKLSDLKVDQVWLDGQSRINFRLRNAGKYTMPDNEHKGGMVRIYFGKSHEDFYLSKASAMKQLPVDPKGALKKVGSSFAYNTKIVLKERLKVKAYVGYIDRITMADKRKGKSLTLTPLGSPIENVTRSPKQDSDHPDQLKEAIKLEAAPKPGDNIIMGVLVVRDIYRDSKDCKLVIELANESTNEIPQEIYKDIELHYRIFTPGSGWVGHTFCLA